jgi:hypothetical protein
MSENSASNVIFFKPRALPEKHAEHIGADEAHHMALYALTKYVAEKLELKQETIEAMLLSAFELRNLEEFRECDFNSAMEYIVGLLADNAVIH